MFLPYSSFVCPANERSDQSTIFAGCRNGNIMQFDKRLGKRGHKLYNDRFLNQQRTSVLHLETLAEWQLLASYMNGDVCLA